jgi:hypothetical protein
MRHDHRKTLAGKRCIKWKRFYRFTVWVQTILWRIGIPWHNVFADECTPDFNCCVKK